MLGQLGTFAIILNSLFAVAMVIIVLLAIWALVLSIQALGKYLRSSDPSNASTARRD